MGRVGRGQEFGFELHGIEDMINPIGIKRRTPSLNTMNFIPYG